MTPTKDTTTPTNLRGANNPPRKATNRQLLGYRECDKAYDFVTAITIDRPLRDQEEASTASRELNNILAFVSYGVVNERGIPGDWEQVFEGMESILIACRLLSLRLRDYVGPLPNDVRYDQTNNES